MWHHRLTWVTGALALLLTFAGCDLLFNQQDAGALQLSIDTSIQQSRSIGPGISTDVDHYVIRGRSDAGGSFEQTSIDTLVVIEGLTAGYWDVTVDAFNEGNVHLYTGSQRILVEGGVALPVMVSLAAVPGTGTLGVHLTWPEGEIRTPVVEAVLIPGVGAAVPLDLVVSGNAASFVSDQVHSGYYTLIVKLKEGSMLVAGAVELVQIVREEVTNAQLTFHEINAPGTLHVGVEIAPEFTETLIVTIDGGEVTSAFGVPVTLTGSVDGDPGNTVFTWYVNGMAVDSGVTQIVIGGEIPGYYRVDLIVTTADGTDGGMATTWVRIAQPGV